MTWLLPTSPSRWFVSHEIDKHLVKAIVDIAVFLEFSPENLLDLDASVDAMEQLAAELQLMSPEAKRSFARQLNELANAYGDRSAFVEGLTEALGLA